MSESKVHAEAWVNSNPHPTVHAFGRMLGVRRIAVCNVQVRERRGNFDPDDHSVCAICARAIVAALARDFGEGT